MDLYVVVEAIAEGRIAFDVAPWPNLDVQGRLRFEKKPRFTRSFLYADAQYVFDRAREDLGLLTRPLRVGDAFRVRDAGEDLTEWEILDDVTHAARRAAKMALYAAVAPRLNEEEAQGRALRGREVREPDRPEDASGDSVAFPVI
jgi:hypothetical protein